MAEIFDDRKIKIIAFYLPQFHEIPENNYWWGEGFTEWTNVKKAKPLFAEHNQPREPLHDNYYDLTCDKTKVWQANLAKENGIFGFCYYHYWFKDGKKLLEKPAEQMLKNKSIKMPFCFSWANENWSRNWDGGNREVIMKQEYGGKDDWEKHLQYLLPFFRDERYITVHGKPLLIIYKPEEIIDIYQMIHYWRKRVKEEGFQGLCMAYQFPTYYSDLYYRNDIFDYRIGFEPVYSRNTERFRRPVYSKKVNLMRRLLGEDFISFYRKKRNKGTFPSANSQYLSMYFYEETWNNILSAKWTKDFLPGGFVDWDNTPRNKYGVLYQGFTPEKFSDCFSKLISRAIKENKPVVFLNAWNEWAEGAYLEPDKKYGNVKLEIIRSLMNQITD